MTQYNDSNTASGLAVDSASAGSACTECNWTNTSLINLGESGSPRLVCQGCCKRAIETLDGIKALLPNART